MRVADFDFDLPADLIAQAPRPRGGSRLLVVDRAASSWREVPFSSLPSLLSRGDLVVANDTRVFPARLIGRRDPTGGTAECLLLQPAGEGQWHALVHPGQKLKPGARVLFEDPERAPGVSIRAEILDRHYFGRRLVRLETEGASSLEAAIDALGHIPLPPYIRRRDSADDVDRYQTIYARIRGSVAAPTAGLHFDESTIAALRSAGIGWTTITLHVGYGTFKPIRVEEVSEHRVDPELYSVSAEAVSMMAAAHAGGHRVVAVGTTTTRALESAAIEGDPVAAQGRPNSSSIRATAFAPSMR